MRKMWLEMIYSMSKKYFNNLHTPSQKRYIIKYTLTLTLYLGVS